MALGSKFCPHCGEATPSAATGNPQDRALKAELLHAALAAPLASSGMIEPPVLPSEISQFYLPVSVARSTVTSPSNLIYEARIYGAAEVTFLDKKKGKDFRRPYRLLTQPPRESDVVRWATGEPASDLPSSSSAENGARWGGVPESLDKARKLKSLEKAFADYLYTSARMVLLENANLGLVGEPGEDVVSFRARCTLRAKESADNAVATEKRKYEPRFQALGVAVPEGHSLEEPSLLEFLNPLTWFRAAPKPADQDKISKRHSEWLIKQAEIADVWRKIADEYTETTLSPRRQDVQVTQFGLAWAPYWEVAGSNGIERSPAYR